MPFINILEQQRKSQNQNGSCSAIAPPSLDRVPVTTTGESSREKESKDKTPVENEEPDRDQKCEGETCTSTEATSHNTPEDLPQQKNKKRCWKCKAKLELAQRELGICKCGKIFIFAFSLSVILNELIL